MASQQSSRGGPLLRGPAVVDPKDARKIPLRGRQPLGELLCAATMQLHRAGDAGSRSHTVLCSNEAAHRLIRPGVVACHINQI